MTYLAVGSATSVRVARAGARARVGVGTRVVGRHVEKGLENGGSKIEVDGLFRRVEQ